ncbi:MAG TPA: hypothetical protein DD435_00085 [Cyanobacteria bacterium UBA8530]|nr:hypothetical protein [Cyanobacteria bacterium UBA8530]
MSPKRFVFPLLIFLLTGCAASQAQRKEPVARADLGLFGIRRVAVIEFEDLTNRGVSGEATRTVRTQLARELGPLLEIVKVLPRPGKTMNSAWYREQIGDSGIQGFISGKITGYSLQRARRRVWVSLNFRLLNSEGSIMWSKSAVGTVAQNPSRSMDSLFEEAATFAIKEFADDFIPPRADFDSGSAAR